MIAIVRRRDLAALEEAVLALREQLADSDPAAIDTSAAFGCCGCGTWMADVRTPRESYCWRCVDRMGITGYAVLPARDR